MADNSSDQGENKEMNTGEVDLSDLQNFNFATNWSEAPASPSRRSDRDSSGRRDSRPDRRPKRRFAEGEAPRGERREGGEGGRPRGDRRERRFDRERRPERPQQPSWRESPFDVQVFPEDAILTTLTRAMRQSLRTYELFEIARLVLEKPERYHANIRYKEGREGQVLLYQSVPDGLPFVSEEGAVDHVLRNHVEKFFTVEQVEVDPPKGSFQFIARCSLTGEFLCPPNFHRYQPILIQYHQERFPDMSFERFRSSIETVKDEEVVQNWLQSMTTQTQYKVAGQEDGAVFETIEQARGYLLQNKKDEVVRASKVLKVPGKMVEAIVDPGLKPFVEGAIEHQKRFPLDTANGLRGRLRRQDFFIYKKGSRGISYVCAAKRKFRQPGQVFADSVEELIRFIESNEMIHASELAEKFLHLPPPAGEEAEGEAKPTPTPEEEEKLKRMSIDLRWLLSEGYVTEFSDGRLQAHAAAEPKEAAEAVKTESNPETEASSPAAEEAPAEPVESAEPAEEVSASKIEEVAENPEVSVPVAEPEKAEEPVEAPADGVAEETAVEPEATDQPIEPVAEAAADEPVSEETVAEESIEAEPRVEPESVDEEPGKEEERKETPAIPDVSGGEN